MRSLSSPRPKPRGRGRLAAKLLDKSVITSATADCALCAYLIGDELENCSCIVVKTSYYLRVDVKVDAHYGEVLLKLLKVFFAIITEIIEDNRGVLAKLLTVFDFTIKYSHWIFVKSVPTGLAKLVFFLRQNTLSEPCDTLHGRLDSL